MGKAEVVPGDLVEIVPTVYMPDQSAYEISFIGKLGIVIGNVPARSSQNIWKVLIEDRCINFHILDLKVVQQSKRNKENE